MERKNVHTWQRFLTAFLTIQLVLPLSTANAANAKAQKPTASYTHREIKYFIPQKRIQIQGKFKDEKGLKLVRCYFRSSMSTEFVFVPMFGDQKDKYSCLLPAPTVSNKSIEYFFLLVTDDNRVFHSTHYYVAQESTPKVPAWQGAGKNSQIQYYREVGEPTVELVGFEDPGIKFGGTVPHSQGYGLVGNIYDPIDIPASNMPDPGAFEGTITGKKGLSKTAMIGIGAGVAAAVGGGIALASSGGGSNKTTTPPENPDDSGSDTDTGTDSDDGGAPTPDPEGTTPPVGPDLRGNWAGSFKTTNKNDYQAIVATVRQVGSDISITTSKSGQGHHLVGKINASGHILARDDWDGEDWSTYYGPATETRLVLADLVCPWCSDLYVIRLYR